MYNSEALCANLQKCVLHYLRVMLGQLAVRCCPGRQHSATLRGPLCHLRGPLCHLVFQLTYAALCAKLCGPLCQTTRPFVPNYAALCAKLCGPLCQPPRPFAPTLYSIASLDFCLLSSLFVCHIHTVQHRRVLRFSESFNLNAIV